MAESFLAQSAVDESAAPPPVTVAWTGASGIDYGLRLLQCLAQGGCTVHLLLSDAARAVAECETGWRLPAAPAALQALLAEQLAFAEERLRVYAADEWTAPLASGSSAPRRMVICPCTVGTLAAVAGSHSNTLLERAADVVLKERGQLIVVPRETPLSTTHLEHMLTLSRLGAVVLPAAPGFYHRPQRVEELIDFIVGRVLDHLGMVGMGHSLAPRWGDTPPG
ncbi:aromatic acid decarboxylase [Halorhodospira abdelmalekii]|uniref:UbiX family flavin prenyltransferase n=1 Tax=Halorhodospira abdelmalekii TaxID=421629 RepID=UPI001904FE4C|nr:flavin prenyltransferase UbiX [Halorhodospira abdelmalekii]MBK1734328.1 aromatic acid decarboxylase [Halorhodospira abdelmalekii]